MAIRLEVTMIACWAVATLSLVRGDEVSAISLSCAGAVALVACIVLTIASNRESEYRINALWETFIAATVTTFLLLGANFWLWCLHQSATDQLYAAGIAGIATVILGIGMLWFTRLQQHPKVTS